MKTFFQTENRNALPKRLLAGLLVVAAMLLSGQVMAQSVLITDPADNVGPNTNSMLEIRSTTKGMLIPRMTESNRTSISTLGVPEAGMLVYQTDQDAGFYYWNGTVWTLLATGSNFQVTLDMLEDGITGDMLYYDEDEESWVRLPAPATDAEDCSAYCADWAQNGFVSQAECDADCPGIVYVLRLPHDGTGTPVWTPTNAFTVIGDGLGNHKASQELRMQGNDIADCGNINSGSDLRYKKDIEPIADALGIVLNLNGVTYDWRQDEFPNMGFSNHRQVGFIAQELEEVFPQVVRTNKEGYKSVNYANMVALLAEAIKDQQKVIDGQQEEITALKAMQDEVSKLKASVELLSEHIRTTSK
jgi:hypothetical protein